MGLTVEQYGCARECEYNAWQHQPIINPEGLFQTLTSNESQNDHRYIDNKKWDYYSQYCRSRRGVDEHRQEWIKLCACI